MKQAADGDELAELYAEITDNHQATTKIRSELDKIKTDVGAIQTQQVYLTEVVRGMQSAVQDLSQQLQIMSEVLKAMIPEPSDQLPGSQTQPVVQPSAEQQQQQMPPVNQRTESLPQKLSNEQEGTWQIGFLMAYLPPVRIGNRSAPPGFGCLMLKCKWIA
ncbi:hypothetical protein ACQJBY_009430 [Aegilops geniculata]